jgi:hypothetical protein
MKVVTQGNLFGTPTVAGRILEPDELPAPKNGHAITLLILMQNRKKWMDIISVIKMYMYPKFQSRLGEIMRVYPEIAEKRKKVVVTRFGNKTDVTEYKLKNYDFAYKIYTEALNVKGGMGTVINGVRVINSDTVASSQ